MTKSPWAKLTTFIMPQISVSPDENRAYTAPINRPLTTTCNRITPLFPFFLDSMILTDQQRRGNPSLRPAADNAVQGGKAGLAHRLESLGRQRGHRVGAGQQHIVETADISRGGLATVRQVADANGQCAVWLPGLQRLPRGVVEGKRPPGPPLDHRQGAEMDVGAGAVGQQPPARVGGPRG